MYQQIIMSSSESVSDLSQVDEDMGPDEDRGAEPYRFEPAAPADDPRAVVGEEGEQAGREERVGNTDW